VARRKYLVHEIARISKLSNNREKEKERKKGERKRERERERERERRKRKIERKKKNIITVTFNKLFEKLEIFNKR